MATKIQLGALLLVTLQAIPVIVNSSEYENSFLAPVTEAIQGKNVICDSRIVPMSKVLTPVVESLIKQNIPYPDNVRKQASEWRDCSGIFLRTSSVLASSCPDQKEQFIAPPGLPDFNPSTSNVVPAAFKDTPRSTKHIAHWYNDRGRFTPVYYTPFAKKDHAPATLVENRNKIIPGSILWFSKRKPTERKGLKKLISNINHMGIVTSVRTDEAGNIVEYEMFHGRNKRVAASITSNHLWDMNQKYKKGKYPPFGFWSQYLVGISHLLAE